MFFSHVCWSVFHSIHMWVSCGQHPWYIGFHHSGTSSPSPITPNMGPHYRGTPGPSPSLVVTSGAKSGDLFKFVHFRISPLLVTSLSQEWIPVQTCSVEDPPPVLLTFGSFWSVYDRQAGNTYPTGMLSCSTIRLCCIVKLRMKEFTMCRQQLFYN